MEDRFYIQDYDETSGLQKNRRPFLIPDKAFSYLQNQYQWRGTVRKRFGSRWMGDTQLQSRLRVNIGTTDGSGNIVASVLLAAGVPIVTPAVGQMFSIGDVVFTVNTILPPYDLLRSDGLGATATFNIMTGIVTINGAMAANGLYYYPALPVMGLPTFENTLGNSEPVVAFDTQFAYQYLGGWERISGETNPGDATWTGNNSQLFWSTTWTGVDPSQSILFTTNFNQNEPNYMRYLNTAMTTWTSYRPVISVYSAGPPLVIGSYLDSALILVPFKSRLNAFNTWEEETTDGMTYVKKNYRSRGRWAYIGDPTIQATAWRQDIPQKGNALDASTTESITTIENIKDRLIVFFERSSYEWVYRANAAQPFDWQQINTELGVESTFSVIPMDKVAIGIGNQGIFACNGTSVERIDTKIPNEVFDIHNADAGVERVYGIRDYYTEMLYWAFPGPDASADFPFPNRVLVYNYDTGTWSYNDDSFTCFGYFQPVTGITWDSQTITWDDTVSWDSGSIAAQFRNVIAGNQEGYVVIIDSDEPVNAPALQITDINIAVPGSNTIQITAINHNLRDGEYVYLQDIVGTGNLELLNDTIFQVSFASLSPSQFQINYPEPPTVIVIAGDYQGGGVISRTSMPVIRTKEYNFYAQKGNNAAITKVDFMVDRTDSGAMLVNYYVSSSTTAMVNEAAMSGTLLGTSVLETTPYALYPLEATQSRLWHPVYITAQGEVIALELTLNDAQMRDTGIRTSPFTLHAICFYAQECGRFQ